MILSYLFEINFSYILSLFNPRFFFAGFFLPYFKCFSHNKSSEDFSMKVSILHMHKKIFFHLCLFDICFIFFSSGVWEKLVYIFRFLLAGSSFSNRLLAILFSFGLIFYSNLVPHITLVNIFFSIKWKLG